MTKWKIEYIDKRVLEFGYADTIVAYFSDIDDVKSFIQENIRLEILSIEKIDQYTVDEIMGHEPQGVAANS